MSTTIKFSPSINIIRDSEYKFNYIATPNADRAFSQLFSDVVTGIKSHVIIGAYGTGKSSFLVAAEQTLSGKAKHFKNVSPLTKQLPDYEFVNIVGEYASLSETVAKLFALKGSKYTSSDIIVAIKKQYKQLEKKGKGLAIIIDEFGKFLEFAIKNKPEAELYFIQQLAEFINDSTSDTLLITTLHQDFNSYANDLNKSQQQEWDKVRGRLKDIVFNEPVEQLLYLASERISQKFSKSQKPSKDFDKLFNAIKSSKSFPLKDYLEKDTAKKLLPFDILSASILTLGLQRYGQNERSLFTFIESNDYLGLEHVAGTEGYFSIVSVYDYLLNNFYSTINSSRHNKLYSQWGSIKKSLERMEGGLKEEYINDAGAILKTIGLLNMFASASGRLDLNFIATYAKLAMGIKNAEAIIAELERYKIIRYTAYNFRYTMQEGTDLDIDLAIDEAGRLIEKYTNIVAPLNLYFDFPFVSAKSVFYRKGTPRIFQFKLSEEPIDTIPEDEVDGFINLVFADESNSSRKIQQFSASNTDAILYCCYQNTADIKHTLLDIQKVKKVIANNATDRAAIKYLKEIEAHHIRLLNHYVLDGLYSDNGKVIWYYRGQRQRISSRHSLNHLLSVICDEVYHAVPTLKSELINKTNVSSQVSGARKNLLERLMERSFEAELGFTHDEFPPEKSIYLSLLRSTGFHREEEGIWGLHQPNDETFTALWNAGTQFLDSCKNKERSLQEFVDIISAKPFKLKQGMISFWLPLFLITRSEEYALYDETSYIPEFTKADLEIILRRPGLFRIKSFNVLGVRLQLFNRYRVLLTQAEHTTPGNKVFIQTIKPFLSFYRELPDYAKKTKRLDKRSLAIRNVIANAKDPEKTFFEDFPTAVGLSIEELQEKPALAEDFIKRIQKGIKEIQTAYDRLVSRIEDFITDDILHTKKPFPDYREDFRQRFKKIKLHLLLPHQKSFYTKLTSEIEDKKAYLNGIVQSLLNKSLQTITDEEEAVLYERIRDWIYELDNLCELSNTDMIETEEDVIKLEITSFVNGLNKNLLRIPKEKNIEFDKKASEIKRILGKDSKSNLIIISKLLQDLLKNEE